MLHCNNRHFIDEIADFNCFLLLRRILGAAA